MRSTVALLLAATLCVVLAPVQAGGKGRGNWMEKMKKCGDGEMNQEEALKGFKECKAQMGGGKKSEVEESERRRRGTHEGGDEGGKRKRGFRGFMKDSCMMVCQWKFCGVLKNETGEFDEAGAEAYINKAYPESKRSSMIEELKTCSEKHSKTFSMEDNCDGYKDFKKCMWKAHGKVCEIKWGKGKGGDGGKGSEVEEE